MRSPSPAARRDARSAVVRRLRRLLWRRRLVVAAACCGLAAALCVHALRPPPPPTADVVLTVRAVAAGEELTADDVTVRAVARELVPPGSLTSVSDAVGRVPVVRLPAGLAMHGALAVLPGIGSTAPPGTVVVPVRLADPAVSGLLRAGDRVDLVAVDDGYGVAPAPAATNEPGAAIPYLARRALVLPLPATPRDAPAALLGGTTTEPPAVTLVAVSPEEAPGLSAVSGRGTVAAVLVP